MNCRRGLVSRRFIGVSERKRPEKTSVGSKHGRQPNSQRTCYGLIYGRRAVPLLKLMEPTVGIVEIPNLLHGQLKRVWNCAIAEILQRINRKHYETTLTGRELC